MSKAKVPVPRSIIIQTLSQRLYSSLASALREVVTNSADAGSRNLKVSFYCVPHQDGDQHHLTFFDDGSGMFFDEDSPDQSDFANYLTLGGKSRRERDGLDELESGRPLIGLMGVGSLAVAPWCDKISVVTKTSDMSQALYATVEYNKFFNDKDVQRRAITDEYDYDYSMIDVLEEEKDKSFTIIDMVNLRTDIVEALLTKKQGEADTSSESVDLGLFDGGYAKISGLTPRGGKASFKKYNGLVRFMHELALMIPIEYPQGAPTNYPEREVLVNEVKAASINVVLQGVKLHRPMPILGNGIAKYDEKDSKTVGNCGVIVVAKTLASNIRVSGYIYWQSKQILFQELTGIQIRVDYVGIGGYDPTGLDYPKPSGVVDKQVSGEIYIKYSEALLAALKTDRENFDKDSKVYKEIQTFVHESLKKAFDRIKRANRDRKNAQPVLSSINKQKISVADEVKATTNNEAVGKLSDTSTLATNEKPVSTTLAQSANTELHSHQVEEGQSVPPQTPNLTGEVANKVITIPLPQPEATEPEAQATSDTTVAGTDHTDLPESNIFIVPLDLPEDIDLRFNDICALDVEDDATASIMVNSDHELFDRLPVSMKEHTLITIAAMAAASLTDPEASPQSMVELSLEHLLNIVSEQRKQSNA